MRLRVLAVALLVVVASVGAAAGTAATTGTEQGGEAYAETYVSFETKSDAVVDYAVNGETIVEGVAVQSQSEANSGGGVGAGADLAARTSFDGAGLSMDSSASGSSRATVEADSGARLHAHDNQRGVLVVEAGGESQFVRANVSGDAEARQEGDGRVVVERDDGTAGAFLVVGDGEVTVNEAGNVSAELAEDAKLVYRQYSDGRSDDEARQEELIASGEAAAEVYFGAEESADSGGETATSVVTYGEDTTVEATERSQSRANMTVERAESEGRVVIASVSEQAVESADSIEVYVDGEAAARADSYGEVRSATQGGENSRFLVTSSANADAAADVVIGINHFSERQVSIQSGGDGSSTGGTESDGTDDTSDVTDTGGQPGFGTLAAVAALGAALLALRRRH
jgi:PGF-CTERM protein